MLGISELSWVLSGKSLLLALVLVAAVAGLWFFFAAKAGFSGGKVADAGMRYADAVGEVADADAGGVGRAEDGGEGFKRNVREPVRGGGERVAVAEESAAVEARLREMQRRDDEGLVVETMPDGHGSIHLQGRFQHVTRLVEAGDGRLVPVCGNFVPGAEMEASDD